MGLFLFFASGGDLSALMAVLSGVTVAPIVTAVFVLLETLAEGVAMDAEFGGGFREVILASVDDAENKSLLEFLDGLFKEDPTDDHLVNESFEFCLHGF